MARRITLVCKYLTTGLILVACLSTTQASAPMVKNQAPGYYRMMLNKFEITALYDGFTDLDVKLLHNATDKQIQDLLARKGVGYPQMRTSVNAFLVNTGSNLVLIDCGTAGLFGPTLGHVMDNLKAAGYTPDQVDAVLITHLHGDHIGGLLDASGKPAFPNATIYSAKADNDFWLSKEIAAAAPADAQPHFTFARDVAASLTALGKWKTFIGTETPIPGIKAISAPGHTPGHTVYEVTSGDQKMLFVGDTLHCMAVQCTMPTVSVAFDADEKAAVKTRLALFKDIAANKTIIAAVHIPFPGIGRLHADGADTYSWVPVEYAPVDGAGK